MEKFKATIAASFSIFDNNCEIDNSQREILRTNSQLVENRVPVKFLKEGDNVTVKAYKIDLNAKSKVSLLIESGGEFWVEAENVFGPEIGKELNLILTSYMGWLFGNSEVVSEILNHTDAENSLWRESNVKLHEHLKKVLKVRHVSKKFGL